VPPLSDAEIEAARQQGQAAAASEPRAARAWVEGDQLCLLLHSGATAQFPLRLLQGLATAPPHLVEQVVLSPSGSVVSWEALNVDFSVPDLLAQRFGSPAWMQSLTVSPATNRNQT
jgi:hypothetical protein